MVYGGFATEICPNFSGPPIYDWDLAGGVPPRCVIVAQLVTNGRLMVSITPKLLVPRLPGLRISLGINHFRIGIM